MDLGILMFPADHAIAPDELAREVESRGFWGLFFPEHTHIPLDHSPFPAGGDLPDYYKRTLDPFVACTAAAVATTDLTIGTGICLVAQHDPIDLAKQVASVDHVSDGRFVFGIGYGWNRPETESHGVAFTERRAYVREAVLAMRELWTEEVASFEGEHVSVPPSWAWPKPVQTPHPPIWMGARLGPSTKAHIAEFCDGWMPIGGRATKEQIPEVRQAVADAGRDPDAFQVFIYGTKPDADQLRYFADIGVDRASFWVPPAGRDEVVPMLDRLARLQEELA